MYWGGGRDGGEHPGFQADLKGLAGGERGGSWLEAIPTLVNGFTECGSQEVGLPPASCVLRTEEGSHQRNTGNWMWDT